MSATTHMGREVEDFVAAVRSRLADLDEEEREELVDGLEADVADLVADRGSEALGDPFAYADELRSAAGLPAARRRRSLRGVPSDDVPDRVRAWWDEVMARPRLAPVWDVVARLGAAWWVIRGWVAAVVIARVWPGWTNWGFLIVPGVPEAVGVVLLLGCTVLSVLVGTRRLWPGAALAGVRAATTRIVLIYLNVGALLLLPVAYKFLNEAQWSAVESTHSNGDAWVREQGVVNGGRQVCNVAAYDAQGQPLTGVQLFDQDGRPLETRCFDRQDTTVPWMLGDIARWNVFPLAERDRPARTEARRADLAGAAFPVPDRATTPPVTHPLLPAQPETQPEAPDDTAEEQAGDDPERDRSSRKERRR